MKMSTDSGAEITGKDRSLESFGLKGENATVFLTFKSVTCPYRTSP